MIGHLRRWIARAVAVLVTVVTLGRLSVEFRGVAPAVAADEERPAITALEEQPGKTAGARRGRHSAGPPPIEADV